MSFCQLVLTHYVQADQQRCERYGAVARTCQLMPKEADLGRPRVQLCLLSANAGRFSFNGVYFCKSANGDLFAIGAQLDQHKCERPGMFSHTCQLMRMEVDPRVPTSASADSWVQTRFNPQAQVVSPLRTSVWQHKLTKLESRSEAMWHFSMTWQVVATA